MIRDIAAHTVAQMDEYIDNPLHTHAYTREQWRRIVRVRDAVDDLRRELETPPRVGRGKD